MVAERDRREFWLKKTRKFSTSSSLNGRLGRGYWLRVDEDNVHRLEVLHAAQVRARGREVYLGHIAVDVADDCDGNHQVVPGLQSFADHHPARRAVVALDGAEVDLVGGEHQVAHRNALTNLVDIRLFHDHQGTGVAARLPGRRHGLAQNRFDVGGTRGRIGVVATQVFLRSRQVQLARIDTGDQVERDVQPRFGEGVDLSLHPASWPVEVVDGSDFVAGDVVNRLAESDAVGDVLRNRSFRVCHLFTPSYFFRMAARR